MSKKIFFFDIDGTLAVKNIIPEDTKEAFKKVTKSRALRFYLYR